MHILMLFFSPSFIPGENSQRLPQATRKGTVDLALPSLNQNKSLGISYRKSLCSVKNICFSYAVLGGKQNMKPPLLGNFSAVCDYSYIEFCAANAVKNFAVCLIPLCTFSSGVQRFQILFSCIYFFVSSAVTGIKKYCVCWHFKVIYVIRGTRSK